MMNLIRSEKGTALVAALFFITALSLSATVIVWVVGSERRVSHNEYSHIRSFYASDAGSEEALNWIRLQQLAPNTVELGPDGEQFVERLVDIANLDPQAQMYPDHEYLYDIMNKLQDSGTRPVVLHRPGWDPSWRDHYYLVESTGTSASESNTQIEVQAARLFKSGNKGGYE